MKQLYRLKGVIRAFYEKYDRYLDACVRFLFSLLVFLSVVYNTGYNTFFSRPFVAVILAVLCALLPKGVILPVTVVLLTVEFFSVSMEVTLIFLVIVTIMTLFYFVFRAGKSHLAPLSMMLSLIGLPAVNLPVGLLIEPQDVTVIAFGQVLYSFIMTVRKDFSVLSSAAGLTRIGKINLVLVDTFSNGSFLILLLATTVSLIVISALRKSHINYAGLVAVISGGFLFLVTEFLGYYFLKTGINPVSLLLGGLLAALAAFVILNFVIGADYRHSEQVQFEDEEYYYYVKAVPKSSISVYDKKVESITDADQREVLRDFRTDEGMFVRGDDNNTGKER